MSKFFNLIVVFLLFVLNNSVFAKSSEAILLDMSVAEYVGAIYPFSEEDDPNQQLGRPNQYVSKVVWADTRIDPHNFSDENDEEINSIDPVNFKGGTIEGFRNQADLNRRYNYIKNIVLAMPIYNQYMYKKGLFLMRLDKELTPRQAKEYEIQFNKVIK